MDEPTEEPQPVEEIEDVVRRVLDEECLDAEEALVVLVRTIVNRHIDVSLRKAGLREPFTPGNERLNALTAVMDALHEWGHRNPAVPAADEFELPTVDAPPSDAPPVDPVTAALPGANSGPRSVQQLLMQMLTGCQFAAERGTGLDKDDDEPLGHMRLVTD